MTMNFVDRSIVKQGFTWPLYRTLFVKELKVMTINFKLQLLAGKRLPVDPVLITRVVDSYLNLQLPASSFTHLPFLTKCLLISPKSSVSQSLTDRYVQ